MFTGIVEEMGSVEKALPDHLTIRAALVVKTLSLGHSICVNGVCLTVGVLDGLTFGMYLSPETVSRSSLGDLQTGELVNLERALSYGGPVGGHLVQGHVDGTGRIIDRRVELDSVVLEVSVLAKLMPYLVEKGCIAIDGVSLTVVNLSAEAFSVNLIPHTIEHTVLGRRKEGDMVNLEMDVMAKYVERFLRRPVRRGAR